MGGDAELGGEKCNKIAHIVVAHGKGGLGDVVFSAGQKMFGQVEAVAAQMIQGGVSDNLFKTPIEFASAHPCRCGKGCYIRRISRVLDRICSSL